MGIENPKSVYVVVIGSNEVEQSKVLEEMFNGFVDKVCDESVKDEDVMEWRYDVNQKYLASLLKQEIDEMNYGTMSERYKSFYDGIRNGSCKGIEVIFDGNNQRDVLSRLEERDDILYIGNKAA